MYPTFSVFTAALINPSECVAFLAHLQSLICALLFAGFNQDQQMVRTYMTISPVPSGYVPDILIRLLTANKTGHQSMLS